MSYDEKLAARIRQALAGVQGVAEKKMFGGLAFLQEGAMFCGIVRDDLMVRVGPEAYEAMLDAPHVRPMDFTGRPMRGYIYVGAAGSRTATQVAGWVACGRDFVSTMKSSPSVDAELRDLLRDFPPGVRRLTAEARGLFNKVVPSAVERVRRGWKLLGFSSPRYFACVAPTRDGVRIGFEHGRLLEDPFGLLEGDGTQMKWITVRKSADLKRRGLAALIAQSAELAPGRRATGSREERSMRRKTT